MLDVSIFKKAWSLLSLHEKRNAWIVLAVVSVAAVSAAFMVGMGAYNTAIEQKYRFFSYGDAMFLTRK